MRPTSLALGALLFPLLLGAQSAATPAALQKGSKLIGGNASFSQESDEDTKVTSVTLQPEMLFFISDGLAVGGRLGLTRQSSDNFKSTGWSLGPAARVYLTSESRTLRPYISASARFGRTENRGGSSDVTSTSRILDAALGFTRLLGDQVGLDGELFVTNSRLSLKVSPPIGGPLDNSVTAIGVRFGFSAFLLQR